MRFQPDAQDRHLDTDPLAQVFAGTSGGDWIVGTAEDDVITGGGGADALAGGAGRDTFVYLAASDSNASAYDNLYDFATGLDRIDLAAVGPTGLSIVRQNGSSLLFANTADGQMLITAAGRAVNGADLVYSGPASLGVYMVGSSAVDTLVGSNRNDGILGGDGADIITGGAGADALGGGAGSDVFRYLAVSDSNTSDGYDNLFDFETGVDRIDLRVPTLSISIVRDGGSSYLFVDTGAGMITVTAAGHDINGWDLGKYGASTRSGAPAVTMIGSEGADRLAAAGNSHLSGGNGDDVLIVIDGGSFLSGGAGRDEFYVYDQRGRIDTITDFQTGVDRIAYLPSSTTISASIVRLDNGDSQLTETFSIQYGAQTSVILAAGRDINASDVRTNTFTPLGFTMTGSNHSDTLIGHYGSDFIRGGDGADILIGGPGSDLLVGGPGSDIFRYGSSLDSTQALPDTIEDFVSGVDKIDLTAIHTNAKDKFGIGYISGGSLIFVDQEGDGTINMVIQLKNVTLQLSDILWANGAGSSPVEMLGEDHGPQALPLEQSDGEGMSERATLALYGHNGGMLTLDDPGMPTGYHHDQNWWI